MANNDVCLLQVLLSILRIGAIVQIINMSYQDPVLIVSHLSEAGKEDVQQLLCNDWKARCRRLSCIGDVCLPALCYYVKSAQKICLIVASLHEHTVHVMRLYQHFMPLTICSVYALRAETQPVLHTHAHVLCLCCCRAITFPRKLEVVIKNYVRNDVQADFCFMVPITNPHTGDRQLVLSCAHEETFAHASAAIEQVGNFFSWLALCSS